MTEQERDARIRELQSILTDNARENRLAACVGHLRGLSLYVPWTSKDLQEMANAGLQLENIFRKHPNGGAWIARLEKLVQGLDQNQSDEATLAVIDQAARDFQELFG